MRVAQIVTSVEEEAAGPSYSVPALSMALAKAGAAVDLMSLGVPGTTSTGTFRHLTYRRDVQVPYLGRRLGLSTSLKTSLRNAPVDVIHGHGLWMMPGVYGSAAARKRRKPFVLSPRGMLSSEAWRFSGTTKTVFWSLVQRRAAEEAACIHATSDAEYAEVRARDLHAPVAVIPNGIDVPAIHSSDERAGMAERAVLSLGRIHPKKGLDRLLRAWAGLEEESPDWRLSIVGTSEGGHADELRALAASLGLSRVDIVGPLYGEEKREAMRRAEVFVLPSLNENFGMTVAESLAAGTPVIATRGTPWSGLEAEGCGWWTAHEPPAIAAALREAIGLTDAARAAMGARGRAWMQRDFSWPAIARQMIEVYQWLLSGGDAPPQVRLS